MSIVKLLQVNHRIELHFGVQERVVLVLHAQHGVYAAKKPTCCTINNE